MSLPSDVNADVAEAVEAMETKAPRPMRRRGGTSPFRDVSPEQYGFIAAIVVAFVGVTFLGPKVREMRRSPPESVADRARRKARAARRQAADKASDLRDEAGKRLRRLGGGAFGR